MNYESGGRGSVSTNITAEVQEGFATRLQPIECEVTSSLSHASHIQNITGELLRGGGGLWKRRGIAPDSWSTRTHRHGEAASAPFPHLPLWECHFFWSLGKIKCFESQKQRRSLGAKGGGNSQYVIGSVWWLPFFQTIFWFKMQQWEIEQLRIFFCELNDLDISYHISQQHLFPWKMSETALMHESFNSWWN